MIAAPPGWPVDPHFAPVDAVRQSGDLPIIVTVARAVGVAEEQALEAEAESLEQRLESGPLSGRP